ncbi:MAG: DNA-directed RNA polymerase subunit omega [Bacteroidales bacterium]|nr:DNA-directed RNA polymerase subunit omega [Bacteroidales bacterium]
MENKEKQKASTVIVTRNIYDLSKGTENIYESVAILSKRANQIAAEGKKELHNKLDELSSTFDGLEDNFENREQVELVRQSEREPKPTLVATQEYLDDKIYFRNPSKEIRESLKLETEENRIVESAEREEGNQ